MSLLPEEILPQTESFGRANEDGSVTIDKNWWLFLYNVYLNSIGSSASISDSQLEELWATDLDAAADPLTAQAIGVQIYPQTAAERAASVTPLLYSYPTGNVLRYGADPSGMADSTAAINNAIIASSLVSVPPGTYAHNGSIVLLPNVSVFAYGATLNYSGSGAQITSPSDSNTGGVLTNAALMGATLNPGSSSTQVIELWSPWRCTVRDILVKGTSTTNFVLDVKCNSTGATKDGNRNAVFNSFENIVLDGSATCGTFIRLKGNTTSGQVVTDSSFYNCHIAGNGQAQVRGIDLAYCCDTIHFAGCTRIALTAPAAASGVGVEINTQDPTNIAAAVYNITFDTLAVDTFGSPAGDARVGLKLNATKQIVCAKYFNSPAAAGGDFVKDNTNTYSYWIQSIVSGTNDMVIHANTTFIGGTDNATCAAGGELSTQDARFVAGSGRTGNGNSYLDLVGDATNTTYGARLLRGNAGANAVTQLLHRGTGNLVIFAQDAGAQVILQSQSGAKLVASNTGLGFYGSAALAQPTTASGSAAFVANAGTAINTLSTFDGYTLVQIVKGLRQMGLFA